MAQQAPDRGYEVVGVCREGSVGKLDRFKGRITVIPGATNDREVIGKAVAGCHGVMAVPVPWGVHQYSSGTAQAVLDLAPLRRLKDGDTIPLGDTEITVHHHPVFLDQLRQEREGK